MSTIEENTAEESNDARRPRRDQTEAVVFLVVAWCQDERWRIGEALAVPPGAPGPEVLFGRGRNTPEDPQKSHLVQHRNRLPLPSSPLNSPSISRYQLAVRAVGPERILVRNLGRRGLKKNQEDVTLAEIAPGDLLQVGNQLLFLCVRRECATNLSEDLPAFPFGHADAHGIVGESEAVWQLRRRIAFVAPRTGHVLVTGPSGTGKELVAHAVHALSGRSARPMVARNAATLPESLIDAELFGNAKNYPNAGMLERPGLIGLAHGSSLFLDEFAELPALSQVHLLRVLDGGEYHRLGDGAARRADFRLISATNRDVRALKHDLLARFAFTIEVPDLNARREDIPLLLRHILRRHAREGDSVALELFPSRDPEAEPALPLELVRKLLSADYPTNVRELHRLLWRALGGETLELAARGSDVAASEALADAEADADADSNADADADSNAARGRTPIKAPKDAPGLTIERIEAALGEHHGSIEKSWRALGLANRFVLLRLIKKYRIEVRRRSWGHSPKGE